MDEGRSLPRVRLRIAALNTTRHGRTEPGRLQEALGVPTQRCGVKVSQDRYHLTPLLFLPVSAGHRHPIIKIEHDLRQVLAVVILVRKIARGMIFRGNRAKAKPTRVATIHHRRFVQHL